MPSPAIGKRYGVTATIRSPQPFIGDSATSYGSSVKIAAQRAGHSIGAQLRAVSRSKTGGEVLSVDFTIIERPTAKGGK